MAEPGSVGAAAAAFWAAVGLVGGCLFYGRFYVQWIVSELRRRSVVPVAFWYMSAAGTLLLLVYAFGAHKPMGALTQCFNIIIYTRNLNHIWKKEKRLSRPWRYGIQTVAAVVALVAITLALLTWQRQYAHLQEAPPDKVARAWFWVAILVIGQALFATRFIIQWAVTEVRRRSVVPNIFWHISIVAAVLQTTAYLNSTENEMLFAIGTAATIPIYVRNLVLIYRRGPDADVTQDA